MPQLLRCAVLIVVLAGFAAIRHADAAVALTDLQAQRRVLLMSAGSAADARLREQQRVIAGWAGAEERDLTVVQIAGDTVTGAAESAGVLRTRFALPAEGFMVLLLGKDGHVALRSTQLLSSAELAGTIDAMPLRRPEAASRRGGQTSAGVSAAAHPTRAQLLGAWRLLTIETRDAGKPSADPFFEAGSSGLIVYDASGWMSVQISGPRRPPGTVPASRLPGTREQDLHSKGVAYDTYYAYFGTWSYDPGGAVMTHHVESSLISAESALDYVQEVELTGSRMTFTSHSHDGGTEITRTKMWERVDQR